MASTTLRRRLWKTPMRDLVRGRITGRLDIEQVIEDAGLPGPAASKVRNVVKRTRLWRLEKVDVAHELIAHFLDGREAGTPMDELLGSFGDETQTAKLIRRAKKRQRPYAWHAFAWARLGFAVIIGVYCLAALYLLTGSPDIKTDYLAVLNRQAAAVPADGAAWPKYREALLEMNLFEQRDWDTPSPYYSEKFESDPERINEYESGPPYKMSQSQRLEKSLSPDDPGWRATVAFLNEHQQAIALIRGGASQPGLGFEVGFPDDYTPQELHLFNMQADPDYLKAEQAKNFRDPDRALIGVLLPHLGPMRNMAKLLAADAERAAMAGDGDTAFADGIAIQRIAQHANEHPLLIDGLVCLSIRNLGYRTVQRVLVGHPDLWHDSQLRDLAHTLAAQDVTLEAWFNTERLWFYDFLQRTYTDDGAGGGQITKQGIEDLKTYGLAEDPFGMTPSSPLVIAGLPAASVLLAPRGEMKRVYDNLMDQAILDGQEPLWQRGDSPDLDECVEAMASTGFTRMRYLPIVLYMPSLSSVSKAVEYDLGSREGVMIGIALTLYRRQHGDWPATLDVLAPTYLPTVPVDRLTGKALRYVVTNDGPVVYSVGVDGDDDGGRPPIDSDGDINNKNASPYHWTPDLRVEREYDGDWVLWPVPREP